MEREACACDHGFERSDLCAEIIIIRIIITGSPNSLNEIVGNKYHFVVS